MIIIRKKSNTKFTYNDSRAGDVKDSLADIQLAKDNLGVDSLSASELVYYFINYGIKVTNTELISGVSINDILSKYQQNNIISGEPNF